MKILFEYLKKLLHQTAFQVTGILGFLISAAFDIWLPEIKAFWAYITTIFVALLVGCYSLFQEMSAELKNKDQEIEKLSKEIEQYNLKQSGLDVGFKYEDNLVKELEYHLLSLPQKPKYDELVNEKRDELLGKKNRLKIENQGSILSGLSVVNPHYEEDVEDYIENYRTFLATKYMLSIVDDRVRRVHIMIVNNGNSPASNITIELEFPLSYNHLSDTQLEIIRLDKKYKEVGINREVLFPTEPELYANKFEQGFYVPINAMSGLQPPMVEPPSEIEGPYYEERNGKSYIRYSLKKLLHNRSEDDFDPFFLWLGDINETTCLNLMARVFTEELPKPHEDILKFNLKFA